MALRATKELFDRMITPAEFEQLPEANLRFELINGKIVEKPMPVFEHSGITNNINRAYIRFDPDEKIGLLRYEVRMRLINGEFRIPDMSYWLAARRPIWEIPTPDAPDLSIEVQSPDQNLKELTEKVQACVEAGVRLAWIIQPNKKIVAVFRRGQSQIEVVPPTGTLDADPVIPGFKIMMDEVFKKR